MCPECRSLERHRQLWLWLDRSGALDDVSRVAHFAPEPTLAARLRAIPDVIYRSADLEPGKADEEVDITSIPWPDECVDFILCSHVLEHVPDDRAAMRELRRILTREGLAIIEVPVLADHTDEDPSLVDPKERLRRFGQEDHVRIYGPDVYDRLADAGFDVTHHDLREITTVDERARFGLAYHIRWTDPAAPQLWNVAVCRRAA